MKKLTFLSFFFVLFFISCSTGEAPYEHRYVIDIVLKPDMKFQRAFIDSTYRLDVPVDYYQSGISGAEIFLIDENSDTFSYSESDTLTGLYYSNDSFFVAYGMEYLVNISVEGELITRKVQVPGSLAISSPSHLDTVSLSSPPLLIWNSCENVFENTYMATAYINEDSVFFVPMLTQDTTLGIFYNRFLFSEKDTMYTILVEAMDSSVYTYLISWGQYGELKEGSAIGLIGALSFNSITVWVTE